MNNYDFAVQVAKEVNEIGGTAYFVGGCERDSLLGIPNKDIDIEIHNVTPYILENILKQMVNMLTGDDKTELLSALNVHI